MSVSKHSVQHLWTKRLDTLALHRFLGIPVFLAIMYLVFMGAMQISSLFQDFFELTSRTLCIEGVKEGLLYLQAPDWLIRLLAFGVGQGVSTTLSFIPVLASLFFALSFLESSGYMARVACVMDGVMRWIGLPGKSFVPLILGFGCNVPAVMAARTLDNQRERILTVLMTPFMSCGARLAIYALFVSAFFPHDGQNIIFGLYLIGIGVALITGFVLRTTVLPGERSPLILALSPYRWPRGITVLRSTIHQVKSFVLKAGALIIPLCVIIGALGIVQDKTDTHPHALATIGRTLTPLFAPMGIQEENWPATVGLLTGVLAKEVVVGTLSALYAEEARASRTIAETTDAAAPRGALGMMIERFGSTAAAFAYLLFVLLYFPCVSVVAVIARELNRSWAVFSVLWTTSIAYVTAVLFYQMMMIPETPLRSLAWIGSMLGMLSAGFYAVRRVMQSKKGLGARPLPTRILISS